MSRRLVAAAGAVLGAAALLAGCGSVGSASGALAGAATGIVTANPAVGVGVGIAVQAATTEVVNRVMKGLHRNQQDAITAVAATLDDGQTGSWQVHNRVPLENGSGHVRVIRRFDTALASCREFAFSMLDKQHEDWYVADICRDTQGWVWASAEPAVERWGTLQ